MNRSLLAGALLALAVLGVTAAGGLAAEPTIEVTGNSLATYAWTPSTAEVASGDSVAFKNATANLHGLAWESGGPEAPSCTGTSNVGKANWSGSCTFAQGGIYHFYCPVHPGQMKGTITVSGPAAPVVSTGSASAVSETEATLNGTVNPSEQATDYFFEYGQTTTYGQKTAEAPAGSGASSVPESATVSGLSPTTTYHFRLVAKNPTGTSHGIDRIFKTTGPELPPVEEPPAVEPAPASAESPSSPLAQAAPPGPPALAAAPEAPDTRLTLKPPAKTRDRTPTLRFSSTAPGATFRCSVDAKPFKACRSPFTTPSLKLGAHRVRVAAVLDGLTDPTPAAARFRVLPPR